MSTLIEELEAVMRVSDLATQGEWTVPHFSDDESNCSCKYIYGEHQVGCGAVAQIFSRDSHDDGEDEPAEIAKANGQLIAYAVNFIRSNHATIAGMASRLEAAEKLADVARRVPSWTGLPVPDGCCSDVEFNDAVAQYDRECKV